MCSVSVEPVGNTPIMQQAFLRPPMMSSSFGLAKEQQHTVRRTRCVYMPGTRDRCPAPFRSRAACCMLVYRCARSLLGRRPRWSGRGRRNYRVSSDLTGAAFCSSFRRGGPSPYPRSLVAVGLSEYLSGCMHPTRISPKSALLLWHEVDVGRAPAKCFQSATPSATSHFSRYLMSICFGVVRLSPSGTTSRS